jgi:hypothetical protein
MKRDEAEQRSVASNPHLPLEPGRVEEVYF